ncbi:Protein of unknown function [Gryllus bimaculatus]|nr:Protein of unknown function [Gryllus bimaculatus]
MTTNVVRTLVLLCLAAVVTLLTAQNAPEDMHKFLEGVAGCHKTYSSISNDTVQYAMIHDMAVPDESNEDARCFVVCVMQNMGLKVKSA